MPLRELADIYPTTGRSMVFARRRPPPADSDLQRCRTRRRLVCRGGEATHSESEIAAGRLPRTSAVRPKHKRGEARTACAFASSPRVGIILLLLGRLCRPAKSAARAGESPFALVGGVLAVFATGGSISIGSLVGFVTLFGITMRNSIMMISHFEHLVRKKE